MPAPPDLIDLVIYESFYGDADDARVQALIPPISQATKNFCDNLFYNTEYTEYFDGGASDQIILKACPIVELGSFSYDPDRVFSIASVIDESQYSLDEESGILYIDRPWIHLKKRRVLKVEYTAGYGEEMEDLPPDLHEAVAKWVGIAKKQWEGDQLGLNTIRLGDAMTVFEKMDPPDEVRPRLMKYKRIGF